MTETAQQMWTTRGPVRIVETDFASMTDEERLRHFEVEGYVVLHDLLDPATINAVRQELDDLPMRLAPYSDQQAFAATPPQWHSPTFAELIAHPVMAGFAEQVLGPDPIFMLGHYVKSGLGVPGLLLHSDYQPFGSVQKGWEESSPATIRVLIYLDDLTVERGAFTFLPRSHLSLHAQANPYVKYDRHPDMVTVCLPAGSGIVFNIRCFHGTHPITEHFTRGMLEYAYRPAWAHCAAAVEEWDEVDVQAAPEVARRFLRNRNAGPAEPTEPAPVVDCQGAPAAFALSPQRW